MKEFIVVPGCLWDGVSGAVAEDRAVLVRDGVVRRIGPKAELVKEAPGAQLLEDADWLMLPAFVNAHDHGRGMSPVSFGTPDQALEVWLQDLNKLPAIPHYDACFYDGVRLASAGVGTVLHSHNPNNFGDICQEMIQAARGYRDAGVRSILCPLYLDQNKRIYYDRDKFIESLPEPLRTNFAAGIRDRIMTIDEYLELVGRIQDGLRKEIDEGWVGRCSCIPTAASGAATRRCCA